MNHGQDMWDKLQFSCEIAQYEKTLISIFQQFCVSIKKNLSLGGRLSTGYNSMGFRDFPGLYWFPRILSPKLFGNS